MFNIPKEIVIREKLNYNDGSGEKFFPPGTSLKVLAVRPHDDYTEYEVSLTDSMTVWVNIPVLRSGMTVDWFDVEYKVIVSGILDTYDVNDNKWFVTRTKNGKPINEIIWCPLLKVSNENKSTHTITAAFEGVRSLDLSQALKDGIYSAIRSHYSTGANSKNIVSYT